MLALQHETHRDISSPDPLDGFVHSCERHDIGDTAPASPPARRHPLRSPTAENRYQGPMDLGGMGGLDCAGDVELCERVVAAQAGRQGTRVRAGGFLTRGIAQSNAGCPAGGQPGRARARLGAEAAPQRLTPSGS